MLQFSCRQSFIVRMPNAGSMRTSFNVAFRIDVDASREPAEAEMREIAEAIAEAALQNRAKYVSLLGLEDIGVGAVTYAQAPHPSADLP